LRPNVEATPPGRKTEAPLKMSVVVPAFNEEKLITASLGSMREAMTAFTARGWETELVVCDNNSTDRTAELARAAGATVVFEPVNQIGRARNTGAAAAAGDWLLFVDADSHPSGALFEEVADAAQSGKFLYGGATIKLEGQHRVADAVTGLWNRISRIGKYAAGSFLFCETAAFRKLGGFDLRLYAGEEIDLSERLHKLARETGRRGIIFHRHPILTSARKVHLYSSRELLRFIVRSAWSPRRTVRDREACYAWYDGRR
jgi:glycosyltransferase involved in cell wall biosynthesis